MAKPLISHSRLTKLLRYNPKTGHFIWIATARRAGCLGSVGYWQIKIDQRLYSAGRLAFFYMTKRWPQPHIDHKNRIRTDDRFFNIREATVRENLCNCKKHPMRNITILPRINGKHGGRRYRVVIGRGETRVYVGRFATVKEAQAARDTKLFDLYGEFSPFGSG